MNDNSSQSFADFHVIPFIESITVQFTGYLCLRIREPMNADFLLSEDDGFVPTVEEVPRRSEENVSLTSLTVFCDKRGAFSVWRGRCRVACIEIVQV